MEPPPPHGPNVIDDDTARFLYWCKSGNLPPGRTPDDLIADCDVNYRDHRQRTGLFIAALNAQTVVLSHLLPCPYLRRHDLYDAFGFTPLDAAVLGDTIFLKYNPSGTSNYEDSPFFNKANRDIYMPLSEKTIPLGRRCQTINMLARHPVRIEIRGFLGIKLVRAVIANANNARWSSLRLKSIMATLFHPDNSMTPPIEQELLDVVISTDTEVALYMLLKPLKPNTPTFTCVSVETNFVLNGGLTLLGYAISRGAIKCATLLLGRPDVNSNEIGVTTSSLAHMNSLTHLLENSCDLMKDADWLNLFRLLLAHPGVDVNYQPKHRHSSVLHTAVFLKRFPAILALLSHPKLNVNIRDHRGQSVLQCCLIRGDYEIFDLLLSRPDVDLRRGRRSKGLLEIALRYKHFNKVAPLIMAGVNINRPIKRSFGTQYLPADYNTTLARRCGRVDEVTDRAQLAVKFAGWGALATMYKELPASSFVPDEVARFVNRPYTRENNLVILARNALTKAIHQAIARDVRKTYENKYPGIRPSMLVQYKAAVDHLARTCLPKHLAELLRYRSGRSKAPQLKKKLVQVWKAATKEEGQDEDAPLEYEVQIQGFRPETWSDNDTYQNDDSSDSDQDP